MPRLTPHLPTRRTTRHAGPLAGSTLPARPPAAARTAGHAGPLAAATLPARARGAAVLAAPALAALALLAPAPASAQAPPVTCDTQGAVGTA
ncbi:hypothetical protein DVA67_015940 [Solirubrobacter sp. CPCC 204708]|nr:hypothetical protein [Solirubrobacter deserti]